MCNTAKIISDYGDKYGRGRIASMLNVNPNTARRWLNQNQPERDFPLGRTIDLMEKTHDLTLLRSQAAHFGFVLIHLPKPREITHETVNTFIRESSEAMVEVTKAMADGEITADEAPAAIKELEDVVEVALQKIASLREIEKGVSK